MSGASRWSCSQAAGAGSVSGPAASVSDSPAAAVSISAAGPSAVSPVSSASSHATARVGGATGTACYLLKQLSAVLQGTEISGVKPTIGIDDDH